MSSIRLLDYLFDPRSAAVIGASSIPGKWGFDILNLLLAKGSRDVYAVNKSRPEVLGVKAYKNLVDVPGPVEFAAITVSAELLPDAMEDCARKGVKAALVISGGFSEVGGEAAEMEARIVDTARGAGIRFIGPNCAGHFNTHADLYTAPYLPPVRKGPVSFVTQSGNLGLIVLAMGFEEGLGFSKYVSSGNEADLHFEDYLEYLGEDENTSVVLGYVEGIRDGERFLRVAQKVTKKKPVIIMKVGRSQEGSSAALSHTAAMSGDDEIYDAAFAQAGVVRVEEVRDLVDVALVMLGQPLPRGNRVAVLTVGGGLGVIAADTLKMNGLELSRLSNSTMEKLNSLLSGRWSHGNPVDTSGDISYPCLLPLLQDENVDAVIIAGPVWAAAGFSAFISTPPWERDYSTGFDEILKFVEEESLQNLELAKRLVGEYGKPVVLSVWVADEVRDGRLYQELQRSYLTPYPTPDRAAKALARLVEYSRYRGVAPS